MRASWGRTWRNGATGVMLACVAGSAVAALATPREPVAEVRALADAGRFSEADARIAALLPQAVGEDRAALAWERERMRRVRLDFTVDRAAVWARVQKQIPDLDAREFDVWDRQGLLEAMVIDGERRWFSRAPHNLFRLSAEARARRAEQVPFREGPMETLNDV